MRFNRLPRLWLSRELLRGMIRKHLAKFSTSSFAGQYDTMLVVFESVLSLYRCAPPGSMVERVPILCFLSAAEAFPNQPDLAVRCHRWPNAQ